MASTNEIRSLTISVTPERRVKILTPVARRSLTDSSFDGKYDDTPVNKMEMSPPFLVKPGKGTGHMKKEAQLITATLCDGAGNTEPKLASPIFSQGVQYPGFDGLDTASESEDVIEGIERTSDSNSASSDSGSAETLIQALDPQAGKATGNAIEIDGSIRTEWLGTTQFFTEQIIQLQVAGYLDQLVAYRKALVHDVSVAPYDPSFHIDLSSVDSKLGFTDTGVANAHRALVLIEAALKVNTYMPCPRNLGTLVRNAIGGKLGTKSSSIIADELESLLRQAYRELVNGLLGCGDFWSGLIQAKTGLKRFQKDPELMGMQADLKLAFLERHNGLKEVLDDEKDLVSLTRTGKIYQKKYPWMDEKLHIRTPALLRYVNTNLAVVGKCEVKPVVFGPPAFQTAKKPTRENEDVGPLGIFAARDIRADEILMVDNCVTGISDVSPNKLQHCEACHAILEMPYMHPSQIVRPTCCQAVAFCSRACHDAALRGYHQVICKKNFDWLFENLGLAGTEGCGTRWMPILFLRVVAVVLADSKERTKKGQSSIHPLQHPLIARMSANYHPADKIQPDVSHDWQYFENVIAPTRIMMQLGINIFTNTDWTPEVIQSIFWRIENNANMARTNLTDTEVVMVNINPNYLFFNHSCEPNVSWHGAVPSGDVSIDFLKGMNGEILNPGSSAVWCTAARDIKKGEELKISYVGDPLGTTGDEEGSSCEGRSGKRVWLEKWFDRGCGCRICEAENFEMDRLEEVEAKRVREMEGGS